MFFVGNEFNPDNGGYKTLAQAQKQAEKKKMKVFDTDGAVVWPEAAAEETTEGVEAAEVEAGVNNPAETENAENGANNEAAEAEKEEVNVKVELTDEVPEGALEDNPDGSTNVYNEAGEKVGTMDKEAVKKVMEAAGEAFIIGTVEVIYKGMIALRNEPKWSDGHKCGIAKTGFKADVVEKAVVKGSPLYKLVNGKWISGKPEHVKFTVAE